MKFSELGLSELVLKALAKEGYETPTAIQQKAIPPILAGSDLCGIAQTGTGKTAAFALPVLTKLAENRQKPQAKGVRALILSPTRELATQIADNFRKYGHHLGMSVAVVFGGVPARQQRQKLARGVDILVATPGRLLDHVSDGAVKLHGTEIFILDEADQMLDMGFVQPIRQIVSKLAAERQNLFFSATMPKQISKLASELLRDPVNVTVAPVASTAERVSQKVIQIEKAKKSSLLVELMTGDDMSRTVVFTRTKRGADRVARQLSKADIRCAAIHGDKNQNQREAALKAFRKSKINVLVATDIAARGIDIDDVSHVVNYELPEVAEAYVHRIGRTARAGKSGQAISLCDNEELGLLRSIERLTKQSIERDDRRVDKSEPEAEELSGGRSRNQRGQRRKHRSANGAANGSAGQRTGARRKKPVKNRSEESAGDSRQKRKPFKGKRPGSSRPRRSSSPKGGRAAAKSA